MTREKIVLYDCPAYELIAPREGWNGNVLYRDGDIFAIAYESRSHGTLFNFYTLGSAAGDAMEYAECPEKSLARCRERGEKTHWANLRAVSITAHKREKVTRPLHKWGDVIQFHGKLFRLDKAPNNNCTLTEVGEVA